MSLLDMCLGGAAGVPPSDPAIVACGKQCDAELATMRQWVRDTVADLRRQLDRQLAEQRESEERIKGEIRRFIDTTNVAIRRQLVEIRDTLTVWVALRLSEVIVQLRLLGIPVVMPGQLGGNLGGGGMAGQIGGFLGGQLGGGGQGRIGGNGEVKFQPTGGPVQFPSSTDGENSGPAGTRIGRNPDGNGTNGGANQGGGTNGNSGFDGGIQPAPGLATGAPTPGFTTGPVLIRQPDGNFLRPTVTRYPDGTIVVEPFPGPVNGPGFIGGIPGGGGTGGQLARTGSETTENDVDVSLSASAAASSSATTGAINFAPVCAPLTLASFLARSNLTVSQLCQMNPEAAEQTVMDFAQELAEQRAQVAARSNPVGIEQPQAMRFQQRQQAWYRDSIEWGGKLAQAFANSPTESAFIQQLSQDFLATVPSGEFFPPLDFDGE